MAKVNIRPLDDRVVVQPLAKIGSAVHTHLHAISEAASLGAVSTTPITVSASISPDTDVNMVGFTVSAGQVVDFDIDTPLNGPGGLGSYLRLFNAQGTVCVEFVAR